MSIFLVKTLETSYINKKIGENEMDVLQGCGSCVEVMHPTPEALAYYTSGNYLWIVAQLLSFIIPGLFLVKKIGFKVEALSLSLGRYWFFALAIFLLIYLSVSFLLELPLDIYMGYFREKAYGLSNQTFFDFLIDTLKAFFVSIVTYISTIWILYALIKSSAKRWWIYGAVVSFLLSVFSMLIQPIWVDPLFNHFSSMKNKVLERQILDLARKAGIENSKVFEVDKSQQTTQLNAYVTGAFHTKRIVLWDTLTEQMPTEEILFVMGHEMGHYVLRHIWQMLALEFFLNFAIFYFVYKVGLFLITKYGQVLGVISFSHFSSFPLIMLLFVTANFLANPLVLAFSRYVEHQADVFGLEITQNNQAAAKAFVRLQSSNLANPRPGPLYVFFRGSHPSLAKRIAFCNHYCPWKHKATLEYGSHFKEP